MENVVQQTTNYGGFKFLSNNRKVDAAHVNNIKKAMEENGNLTKVVPVLVNQKMEIIDGQHRFQACKELGLPVYYSLVSGLDIHEARSMNILQKNWSLGDFAKSYADSGNVNYQKYITLRETYGLSDSVTLVSVKALSLTDRGGGRGYKQFKAGELTITDEQFKEAKETLEKLAEITEYTNAANNRAGAFAFLRIFQSKNYNHTRMISRLKRFGKKMESYSNTSDCLRQAEDVYNMYSRTRIRLF